MTIAAAGRKKKLQNDLYVRIAAAKLYIDKNYDQPMQLADAAQHAHLSKYHFLRLFRQTYEITPHQYVIAKRVARAKELLAKSSVSIAETAAEVGFESITTFTSLFKEKTGYTPAAWRNHNKIITARISENPKTAIPHCFIHVLCGE